MREKEAGTTAGLRSAEIPNSKFQIQNSKPGRRAKRAGTWGRIAQMIPWPIRRAEAAPTFRIRISDLSVVYCQLSVVSCKEFPQCLLPTKS